MKFCTECGTKADFDEQKFCKVCGHKFPEAARWKDFAPLVAGLMVGPLSSSSVS